MKNLLIALILGFGLANLSLALIQALYDWFALVANETSWRIWTGIGSLTVLYSIYIYIDLRESRRRD